MKKLFTAAAALLPAAVRAHPGDHGGVTRTHLLSKPDHFATQAMTLALGIAAWLILRGTP